MRYMQGYTRLESVGRFEIFRVANFEGVYYTIEEDGCVVGYFDTHEEAVQCAFENL